MGYNIILTTACCSVYMVCHKYNNEVDVINFVAISQFVVLVSWGDWSSWNKTIMLEHHHRD